MTYKTKSILYFSSLALLCLAYHHIENKAADTLEVMAQTPTEQTELTYSQLSRD